MLWCRYLKSRTAIVASNFWASKYFGPILLAHLGFGDFGICLAKIPFCKLLFDVLPGFSVTACPKAGPCFHCWTFVWPRFFALYVIVCLWLSSLLSISVLHGLSNTANCSRHKTCPSTNSRATICQCQWDATIHGYLGSLFAEQLLPIKKIWNIKWKWTNNWKFGVIMWSNQKFCRGGYFDKNMDKPSCKR